MTSPHDADNAPELTTTRIGGGRGVWVTALGVVLVLGGFAYVGVTGPTAPLSSPSPRPSNPVAAVSVTPTPHPTPDPNQVVSIRADPTAPVRYQYLGTGLTLNGHGTLAVLDSIGPDQYRGIYRIPYALAEPTARLELDAVSASVSNDNLDRLGSWQLATQTITKGGCCPTVTILDTSQSPQNMPISNPDFTRIATNGFRLTVTAQNNADAALMTIDVTVNADASDPNESYTVNLASPNGDLAIPLEQLGPGGYDGQAPVPSALMGRTVPVSLSAAPVSNPPLASRLVGEWSIRLPGRPGFVGPDQIEVHEAGRPLAPGEAQILATGYDLVVNQVVINGELNLSVVLNVHALGPAPTR